MYLIIGNGLIGRCLYSFLGEDAIITTRKEIDLSQDDWDIPKCETAFICAAISSTAECEANPEKTRLVNVSNTVRLAERLKPAQVVWISSERVFDGSLPFRKISDKVCPTTEYGRQKAEAEEMLLQQGATVIRFAKVLGSHMPLFEEWITRLGNNEIIHPYSNMVMSPLPVSFVVRFMNKIASLGGLYQVSALEDLTYDRVACHIANYIGKDVRLVQSVAAREGRLNSTLDSGGICGKIGMNIPYVWDTINQWCEDRIGRE